MFFGRFLRITPILFLLIIKQLQRKLKKTLLFKVQNSLVKYIILRFGYAYEKGHTFLTKTKNKIMENWTNTFGSFINKLTQRKKLFDLHHQDGETVEGSIYYEDSFLEEKGISICKYDLCKFLGLEVCEYYGDVSVIEMHHTFNFHDGYDQEEQHTYLGDYQFEHKDIIDYLTEKNIL